MRKTGLIIENVRLKTEYMNMLEYMSRMDETMKEIQNTNYLLKTELEKYQSENKILLNEQKIYFDSSENNSDKKKYISKYYLKETDDISDITIE